MSRTSWATRFGFYFAAIGSAVGLGNLWRFPYVVGENGGGAFVLLYIFVIFVVGMPLLIAELILGKTTGKGVVSSLSLRCSKKCIPYHLIGRAGIALTVFILAYYSVISGWVLHFLIRFFVEMIGIDSLYAKDQMNVLLANGWLQIFLASINILFCVFVVAKGVQEGLERWIGYFMPVFFILLIVMVIKSLSLETREDALRFLLYPRFSNLSWSSLNFAIGHALFTLSVGMGIMITFGGYLPMKEHVPTVGFRVAIVDMILSGLAVLLVFPMALNASDLPLRDPTLMFEALINFFHQTRGGSVFGFLFFLSLYIAALGASVGLLEVGVADAVERKKMKRGKASTRLGLIIFVLSMIPAFSSSVLKNVHAQDKSILEMVDLILINGLLPILAIGISLSIASLLTEQEKEKSFIDENRIESVALYPAWKWSLRWFIPLIIFTSLVLSVYQYI